MLFILDSLGGTELLVILVVALIIFGPRKLPQLSRSIGKSLVDFKRTSNEFRQTWEREASLAELETEAESLRSTFLGENTISPTVARERAFAANHSTFGNEQPETPVEQHDAPAPATVPPPSVTPVNSDSTPGQPELIAASTASEPTRKRDWL
ncbi:MAG TPA: twin-arginine translocase TatA/TatE family subunit [Pyrinomonadaceae bacterium]